MCPRLFAQPWTTAIIAAMSWFEQGSLGLSFMDAPAWLHHAFTIVSSERATAAQMRREMERSKSAP